MIEQIKYIFSDYTFQIVALGSIILGIISGIVGSYAVLRRQSLLGDAISHSTLPGIVIFFLITGTKKSSVLLYGATLFGIIAIVLIFIIVNHSKIKFDGAMALVMSTFFGLGLVLLTYAQKLPNANYAGLAKFIFGQSSSLNKNDVLYMSIVGFILFVIVMVFWKELKVFIFDQDYAKSLGLPIKKLDLLISLMIVSTIIIGLQTVGVILMSSMLLAPVVCARQWTTRLASMMILASTFGAVSGFIGTTASSLIDRLPTGPTIVLVISIIFFISILFPPKRGIIWRLAFIKKSKKEMKLSLLKKYGGAHNDSSP